MKRKRYTEEQIIAILKEHEAGASVPDLSRRHGVVENTIYRSQPPAPSATKPGHSSPKT